MPTLSDEEVALLQKRRASFEEFLAERMPVLSHFMHLLELPNPTMVLVRANEYAIPLSKWLSGQEIGAEDRNWLLIRLGYFVGEYFVQMFGGHWFLNEEDNSKFLGRYVVGHFKREAKPNACVDPFEVAESLIASPPRRDLLTVLAEVQASLTR